MKTRFLILDCLLPILLVGVSHVVFSQINSISIQLDNDLLTDRYYTAGMEATYSRFIENKGKDENKFHSWHGGIGFKIFTPNLFSDQANIEGTHLKFQDRPFAGYRYLFVNHRSTSINDDVLSYKIILGQVGPQSKMKELQNSFHELLGYERFEGWDDQIRNELVIDFSIEYTKSIVKFGSNTFFSQNEVQLGSSHNFIQSGLRAVFGSNSNSSSLYSWINSNNSSRSSNKVAFSVDAGLSLRYVISNIFIQGSLFEHNSPVTAVIEPVVFQSTARVNLNFHKYFFRIGSVWRTKNFELGANHFYFSLLGGFVF